MVQIKEEAANILEYEVNNNANIANVMCLWKPQMEQDFHWIWWIQRIQWIW